MFVLINPSFYQTSSSTPIHLYSYLSTPNAAALAIVRNNPNLFSYSYNDIISIPYIIYNSQTNQYYYYIYRSNPTLKYQFLLEEQRYDSMDRLSLFNKLRLRYIAAMYTDPLYSYKRPKSVGEFLDNGTVSTLLPPATIKQMEKSGPIKGNDIVMSITTINDDPISITSRSSHISAIEVKHQK